MTARLLKPDIHAVGAIDWDRRLFDELIPLPDGTTYNSYLIKGSEKTSLVDSVDPAKQDELITNLRNLGVKKLDYVIAHHGEQDHSGGINKVLECYPGAKVVTNQKCKTVLVDLLHIPEDRFIVVKDNDTLSLGNKTLQFVFAPWVHWPETMLTYLKEDKVLFTCDLFGSHFATSDLFVTDECEVYKPIKRYYAEIMMPFRTHIKKHLERIDKLSIDIIATSHGPIYNKPKFVIDLYKEWTSDQVKNEVILPFVSMHGSVREMVEHFIESLMSKGITVKPFNLTQTDIGELAMALVDASTIVLGSPTVLAGPHPAVVYAAYLANALRPKIKFASIIGSYSWGGKMPDIIKSLIPNLKVELLDPVIIKGCPRSEDFKALDNLSNAIATKHKDLK